MTIGSLSIAQGDGFKQDRFGRENFAKLLISQIVEADKGSSLALDAPWGAGKTIFLQQLADQLRSQGWIVVYYDAFAEDYEEDAFLPLMASIVGALPKTEDGHRSKNRLIKNALPVGKRFLGASVRLAAKAATYGMLDTHEWGVGLESGLAKESDALANAIAARLEANEAKQIEIQGLAQAISEISNAAKSDEHPDAQLLIIVDELDRCRPEFAVQTLERVKHLFGTADCKFVFGVNQPELAAVVKGYYGDDFSGRKYLQRFFDLEVGFPSIRRSTAAHVHLGKFLEDGRHRTGLAAYVDHMLRTDGVLFEPTPRDIERLIQQNRSREFNELNSQDEMLLISCLALAKICRPDRYHGLKSSPPKQDIWNNLYDLKRIESALFAQTSRLSKLIATAVGDHLKGAFETKSDDDLRNFDIAQRFASKNGSAGIIGAYAAVLEKGLD